MVHPGVEVRLDPGAVDGIQVIDDIQIDDVRVHDVPVRDVQIDHVHIDDVQDVQVDERPVIDDAPEPEDDALDADLSIAELSPSTAAALSRASTSTASPLRRKLIAVDAVVVAAVWLVVAGSRNLTWSSGARAAATLVETSLIVLIALLIIAVQHLYRARVCAVRRTARRRLAVAALMATIAAYGFESVVMPMPSGWRLFGGALATYIGLVVAREIFEQWLRASRARGRHSRPVVVMGERTEVADVVALLEAHPEAGCHPVAWIGRTMGRDEAPIGSLVAAGPTTDVVGAVRTAGVTSVVLAPSMVASTRFHEVVHELQAAQVHVQLWSGLWGIDHRRLRAMPVAHEPFFYLEPAGHKALPLRIKRALDIVIASLVLVLTSPLMLVAAVLVKLHDGGPVFFRQVRIGHRGRPFELRKIRTMSVDAESQVSALREQNERNGPLFKIAADPRVTPIGRLLRASSIDELPQLLDVLAGHLSLVGPRPALPDEVAEFDDALLARHHVLPGVTGLWQVEARHNPSFYAYRHLDLFYVENWSLGLDMAILMATIKTVLGDALGATGSLRRRNRSAKRVAKSSSAEARLADIDLTDVGFNIAPTAEQG